MPTLYEQLHSAGGNHERRAITHAVIDAMRVNPNDSAANEAYYSLCETVIRGLGHTAAKMSSNYAGEFPPLASAALVLTRPRVSGFLNAIHRIKKADDVIEAGPGASAIFSVAAATRGAHVIAVEMNPQAAECAEEIARLTGYASQIQVKTGNALVTDLPGDADIAIAEILGPGLRGEVGPAVIAALKRHARHVVPDSARLYATDVPAGFYTAAQDSSWHQAVDVNLAEPATRVAGAFKSTGSGLRQVRVRADIMAQGTEIVAGLGADDLTSPIAIGGHVSVPRVGTPIEFAYDIGPAPHVAPDYVRVIP